MAQASFGRKWLAGILRSEELSPEEKDQQIMEGHIAVTDGLKVPLVVSGVLGMNEAMMSRTT